jgi:hypothetical protein
VGPGEVGEEDGDDLGVPLAAGAVGEDRECLGFGLRFAVGAGRGEGVEGVGDGQDAGGERDRFASEAVWVAGAVPALVVVADGGGTGGMTARS